MTASISGVGGELMRSKDRHKPFMLIVRQWREVKRMKRFKRGHEDRRVCGTKQGELALMCRACPQVGWNLPDRWEKIETLFRFIYWLFLAQDTNFRLSNRNISSEVTDPILGDGFAMFMANTKRTKGLHTTGVGGVTCSHHNMWEGNGIGDLQVGERYCNMDFLLLSVLFWFQLLCRTAFSFHFMWGAGMTHGEGVEQNWSFSNGAAASTRVMGPGARQTTLEDIFGFHNYDRVLAMHCVLPRRLASFRESWKSCILTSWLDGRKRCMFGRGSHIQRPGLTVRVGGGSHRGIYVHEEGTEIECEHSPGVFLTMGMMLEEAQCKLGIDVRALKNPSVSQKLAFTKRRTMLLKRIHKFRQVQGIYMSALHPQLSNMQKEVYDGNGDQQLEATRLFMPSELTVVVRAGACVLSVAKIEARLRYGEACEALDAVRYGLRTRTMMNRYKLRNFTGQGRMTKGQGMLQQINIKIHATKVCYRYARATLLALHGHGDWEERLRVLSDNDMRTLNERALTAEKKAQNDHWAELRGAFVEGGMAHATGLAAGEGSHTLSWIWYTIVAMYDEQNPDPKLHDALLLEWSKVTAAEKWEKLAEDEITELTPELTEGCCAYAAEHVAVERRMCARLGRNWVGILAKADVYLEGMAQLDAKSLVRIKLDLEDEVDLEDEEAQLEAEDN
ncbi:hypothetical protein K438DRAFT_1786899 [Mycena galopus ATCC 62051]|nr:hypothetical protein K438DRAFT_1786899 [Mycena galopus ATCC 62051]